MLTPSRNPDAVDGAIPRRPKLVLHLHRLDDQQLLAGRRPRRPPSTETATTLPGMIARTSQRARLRRRPPGPRSPARGGRPRRSDSTSTSNRNPSTRTSRPAAPARAGRGGSRTTRVRAARLLEDVAAAAQVAEAGVRRARRPRATCLCARTADAGSSGGDRRSAEGPGRRSGSSSAAAGAGETGRRVAGATPSRRRGPRADRGRRAGRRRQLGHRSTPGRVRRGASRRAASRAGSRRPRRDGRRRRAGRRRLVADRGQPGGEQRLARRRRAARASPSQCSSTQPVDRSPRAERVAPRDEPVERQRRLDPADLRLVERAPQAVDRRIAVGRVDHQLGDEVVVVRRHAVARLDRACRRGRPGRTASTQRPTRPGVGANARDGSSAAIRTSIAWLAGVAARSAGRDDRPRSAARPPRCGTARARCRRPRRARSRRAPPGGAC